MRAPTSRYLRAGDHQHIPAVSAALPEVAFESQDSTLALTALYGACHDWQTTNGIPTVPVGAFRRIVAATGYRSVREPGADDSTVFGLAFR